MKGTEKWASSACFSMYRFANYIKQNKKDVHPAVLGTPSENF